MIRGFDGPDRSSDADRLTDAAEVAMARLIMFGGFCAGTFDLRMIHEIESYEARSAEELAAQRDLELWGYDPFTEYEE